MEVLVNHRARQAPTLLQPVSQPVPRANCATHPARRTEAARADIKLLQPRQRPAQAKPCANRVVTTRRQPVVTTRTLPQRTMAYAALPQVTAPRDGLTARQSCRPRNAICHARSLRAMSAMAPPGAPRALGEWLDPMTDLQQQAPSMPMPRAAAVSRKISAQNGSGVPCPL